MGWFNWQLVPIITTYTEKSSSWEIQDWKMRMADNPPLGCKCGIPATEGQQLRSKPTRRAQLHGDGHTTCWSCLWLLTALGPVLIPQSW